MFKGGNKGQCANISLHPHLCNCKRKPKARKGHRKRRNLRLVESERLDTPILTERLEAERRKYREAKRSRRVKVAGNVYLYDQLSAQHDAVKQQSKRERPRRPDFLVPQGDASVRSFPSLPAKAVYPLLFCAEKEYKRKLKRKNKLSRLVAKRQDSVSPTRTLPPSRLKGKFNTLSLSSEKKGGKHAAKDRDKCDKVFRERHLVNAVTRQFDKVPPAFLHYAKEYSATLIQTSFRGFLGRRKSKERRVLLQTLKKVARPFYWRREMERVYRCFANWVVIAQHKRLNDAAVVLQRNVRVLLAKLYVARIHKSLTIFKRLAYMWRGGWAFKGWRLVAWHNKRIRAKRTTFKRWRLLSRATRAFRVAILWAGGSWRNKMMKGALTKWWWMAGQVKRREELVRTGVAFSRFRRNRASQIRKRRQRKKNAIVHLRLWKNLSLYRKRANRGALTLQRVYRGWIAYKSVQRQFFALRDINRIVRGHLGRLKYNRLVIVNVVKRLIGRWRELAPEWRIQRLKREKRRLYKKVVQQRHWRRAHSENGNAPPSFEVLLLGMDYNLDVEQRARQHGIDIEKLKRKELLDVSSSDSSSSEEEAVNAKRTNFKTSYYK